MLYRVRVSQMFCSSLQFGNERRLVEVSHSEGIEDDTENNRELNISGGAQTSDFGMEVGTIPPRQSEKPLITTNDGIGLMLLGASATAVLLFGVFFVFRKKESKQAEGKTSRNINSAMDTDDENDSV